MKNLCYLLLAACLLFSCAKEKIVSVDQENLQTEKSLDGSRKVIKNYLSTDLRHSLVAKTMSAYFENLDVRVALEDFMRKKESSVILLSDFIYNRVVDDPKLRTLYTDSADRLASLDLYDLINIYLYDYPGLEISFIDDSDNDFPEISENNFKFETVSVYHDIDSYPIYVNGTQKGSYSSNDEPSDKNILKLQSSDVYDVVNTNDIKSSRYNGQYHDLLSCGLLEDELNNLPFIPAGKKVVGGSSVSNPLGGTKTLVYKEIFDTFNRNCGTLDLSTPTTPNGPTTVLMPCDRDEMINEREHIVDIHCPNGKQILRDCNKWCNFWNRYCNFQVDIFIPVAAPSAGEFTSLGSLMKIISVRERSLRKKYTISLDTPITEWLFLEGDHGDEWQYTWTGRHRRRGQPSKTTIGVAFGGKVTFKVGNVGVELSPSIDIKHEISRANEDCELGTEISRYCRDLEEFLSLGEVEYHVTEKDYK